MSVSFQVAVAKSYNLEDVNRDAMVESKINRTKMSFMQPPSLGCMCSGGYPKPKGMEADAYNKRVNSQLSDMRRDDDLKARVDKIALEKTATRNKGVSPTRGPTIVTHSNKKIFEGHAAKREWGPLGYD